MGKGAGEMDSILQLAGGLLVGGYALYHMAKDGGDNERKPAPSDVKKKVTETEDKAEKASQKTIASTGSLSSNDDETKSTGSATSDSSVEDYRPSWMTAEPAQDVKKAPVVVKKQQEEDVVEDFEPSWMSKKDPQTNVDEIPTSAHFRKSALRNKGTAVTGLASANDTVSSVAFAFSDSVFVYPGANKNAIGEKAAHKAAVSRNAFQHTVAVQMMETRAGAGEAVVGALSNGSNASILTTSASLKEMIPAMFEMASERLPAVIHAAAFSVDADLAIRQDLSEVMAVRDIGFSMLASGSAQETHDIALVSHIVAHKFSAPVLHFFDGSRMDQLASVQTLSDEGLEEIAQTFAAKSKHSSLAASAGLEAASHKDRPHMAAIVGNVFQELAPVFGREYHVMEYVGSPVAEAVVVAMGAAASVLEANALSARNIGVLKVRLLKPWSVADFLKVLPETVRRICVLDQAESTPLFNEVAASFYSETAMDRKSPTPLLVGGRILPNSRGFNPAMVYAVLSNLMCDRPQPNFVVGDVSSSLSVDYSIGPDSQSEVKQLVAFTSNNARFQLEVATHVLAEQLSTRAGLKVQQFCASDAYAGDAGVARAELRIAPAKVSLPESYAVSDAQVVLVEQGLLASSGLAAVSTLKEGGTLVILPAVQTAGEEGSNELEIKDVDLPIDVKVALARKAGKVVVVDSKSLFASAIEAGHIKVSPKLQVAALWVALAGAIKLVKGATVFSQLVNSIKSALQLARPFADESNLVSVVSSSLTRVEGYLVVLGKENVQHLTFGGFGNGIGFGAPVASRPYFGGSNSSDSDSFGGMSPIHGGNTLTVQQFTPRLQVEKKSSKAKMAASLCGENGEQIVALGAKAALPKLFPEAYAAKEALRPSEHGVHLVRLTKNVRLTPNDYERNIFHLEFDISGTSMKYQIGDALGVYGHNDEEEVDAFIRDYGLNPNALVSIPSRKKMEKGLSEMMSVRNLLIKHLDLFGKPSKKFYVALAGHATTRYEYLKLMHIGTDDNEQYKLGVNEGVTYADLLIQYKTANPTIEQIIEMVPPIQARHYSIASSMKMNPRSVHLLVVAVDWITPLGRKKYGQCTRYLSRLDPTKGDIYVSVDVMPSVLRMPPSPKQPIIMAGLGTGMAPFRAFVQERKYQKEMGLDVGPVVLFFGSRHRHQEWLYGEEWEAYEREGLVTHLGLAFSRDQKEKIYIQDRMNEVSDMLRDHLSDEKQGVILLCGPTWPVPAINAAISKAMNPEAAARGEIDFEQAEKLKSEGRFTLEVY